MSAAFMRFVNTCIVIAATIVLPADGQVLPPLSCGGANEPSCAKCRVCSYNSPGGGGVECAENPENFTIETCAADRPYCYIAFWIVSPSPTNRYAAQRGCSNFFYDSYTSRELVCHTTSIDSNDWTRLYGVNGEGLCDWGSEHGGAICRCNPAAAGDGCNSLRFSPHLETEPAPYNFSVSAYIGTYMTRTTHRTRTFPSTKYPVYNPNPRERPINFYCYHCTSMTTDCANMTNIYPRNYTPSPYPTLPARTTTPVPPNAPTTPNWPFPCDFRNHSHYTSTTEPYPEAPTPPPIPFDVLIEQCTEKDMSCMTHAIQAPSGQIRAIRKCVPGGRIGCNWKRTARGNEVICHCAWNFCNAEFMDDYFLNATTASLPFPPFVLLSLLALWLTAILAGCGEHCIA